MKKIILLTAIAAGLMGCSKGTYKPVASTASLITAQWYYTLDSTQTYSNGTPQQLSVKQYAHTDYVTFNADKTGIAYVSSSGSKYSFTYTIAGNNIILSYPSQTILGTTTPAYSQSAVIRKVNANSLELYFDNSTVSSGVTIRVTEASYFGR